MKKKILAGALALMMVLGLAGCSMPFGGSKGPTAEELVNGIQEMDQDKYNDMEMSMKIEAESEGQTVGIGLTTGVEMRGDLVHVYDMKMNIGMAGFSIQADMEGWVDMASKVSYMRMSALGQDSGWTKSSVEDDGSLSDVTEVAGMFSNVDTSKLDLTLQEHEKGSDYVVTWSEDAEELGSVLGGLMDSYASADSDITLGDAYVEATFDESTQRIKSIHVTADASQGGDKSTVDMTIIFKTMNGGKDLAIPADVLENAVEEGPDDGGEFGGFGDDGFFWGDGSTGDDGGDWVNYSGNYSNDNEGYDEYIDEMAKILFAQDPDCEGIYVTHYEGSATMAYYMSGNDWSGSMEICHYGQDCDWQTAEAAFWSQYEWMQSWYDGADPFAGSLEEGQFVFCEDRDDATSLDFAAWDGEFYFEGSVYMYGAGKTDEAGEHLVEMMDAIGMSME